MIETRDSSDPDGEVRLRRQDPEALQAADAAARREGLAVYRSSVCRAGETVYALARGNAGRRLVVVAARRAALEPFDGSEALVPLDGGEAVARIGPCTPAQATALRERLPFLAPRPIGLARSAGCGDRLGLATPGHLRAFRESSLRPVLAQQSMRENARTGRTPQAVVDDAMWGVLQEGWDAGYGADADHLKTLEDVDGCVPAGYTMYTIDPSAYVENAAESASRAELEQRLAALPWEALETTWNDTRARFSAPIDLGTMQLRADEGAWRRAAVKYGRVVAHTVEMSRHVSAALGGRPFDLEISVDESDAVTTLAEHVYIASELRRLRVHWTSLAPRYVGTFEKGVDYIGDLAAFEGCFTEHLAVARTFGPYKLSLHSGSDKFRIFGIASRVAGELVHLKTSGTTYLEALRAVGRVDPALFREIAVVARARYPTDRVGYHVSADVERMPDPASLPDADLPALLDDFHGRQVLHVTFGSLMHHATIAARIRATLRAHEETYAELLRTHFARHFAPFEA